MGADDSGKNAPQPVADASATPDDLDRYRKKRRPLDTTEPFGAERKRSDAGSTLQGRFVVHLHRARNQHYDLRLQIGRTLKSFAVPRGPSLHPNERRLAVLTEDHPLEYVDFEDVIPAGNYGAGAMIAWDLGRVGYLELPAEVGMAAGKIDFWLFGHKLNGRFALVRTKRGNGAEWLLLKKRDAHSREQGDILLDAPRSVLSGLEVDELVQRAEIAMSIRDDAARLGARERPLPPQFEPMACADEGATLEEPARLYELKLDGVRIVAEKHAGSVSLRYRNGRNCSHSYPEIARAVAALPGEDCVLDGEVVALDEEGRPRFQRLGSRIHAQKPLDVANAVAKTAVSYWVFDLLALGGFSLVELPLIERKGLLARLIRGRGLLRTLDHLDGRGKELFALCQQTGLEGVVAKARDSTYQFGPRRGPDWVKFKCERDDSFVVVGYLPGKGARAKLGALGLASYQAGKLIYRGRVGSGLTGDSLAELEQRLAALVTLEASLSQPIPDEARKLRWLRPELVIDVKHEGFTDEGRLRAAVFVKLRDDLPAAACDAAPREEAMAAAAEQAPAARAAPTTRVVLSHREKVFWPEHGYTKGDLLDYYAAVSGEMLPFLRDRPVILVRYPDGIHGKSFYQWNVPRGTPDWIRRLSLQDDEEPEREKVVFLVDDTETLLYIANLGCIPLHVLASRAGQLDTCDFITFDLDLNEQPFARAVEIALTLREVLSEIGLLGFPKTSGQGGLHVLVPLGPGIPFTAAKLLVELIGRIVTARHSSFATMERRIEKRGGRLYVDTGQTGTSRSIVAPYSVRAAPGGGVSTPLFWDELSGALDPARFTLMTVPARIAELGDPFAALLRQQPNIARALEQLSKLVQ